MDEMTWRSIDSAPKDGTCVLVIDMTAAEPEAIQAHWAQHKAWDAKPAWLCSSRWPPFSLMTSFKRRAYGEVVGEVQSPTHWMPLPPSPASEGVRR